MLEEVRSLMLAYKSIAVRLAYSLNCSTVAYADSGVDINEGSLLIERIKSICDRTKLTATDYV